MNNIYYRYTQILNCTLRKGTPFYFLYSPQKCTFECIQKVSDFFGLKGIRNMSFLTPPQNRIIMSSHGYKQTQSTLT